MELDTGSLKAMFDPDSIAVIGATQDFTRIGGRPIDYLLRAGYKGKVYPVNPKYDEIAGLRCYHAIEDIPGRIDLAILAVPRKLVVAAVRDCVQSGVRSMTIFSSGFAEVGGEGAKLEGEIVRLAKENKVRVLGPNCLGMFNVVKGAYATFSVGIQTGRPELGRIGFVTQSGAVGSHVFSLARERQIGLSYWMATGNESDVDVADCIAYLAVDPDTDVIAAYMEGSKNGEKLIEALRMARHHGKPVVVLKVGRSEAGKRAALSHTASMAGSDAVYAAIFDQEGAYRAETIEEFLDIAYGCSELPIPRGDRIAVFTVSGGVGILMADQLSDHGLCLPETPKRVQETLLKILPYASVENPIDTTAQLVNQQNLLRDFIDTTLESDIYDLVMIFLAHGGLSEAVTEKQLGQLEALRRKYPHIPCVMVTLVTPKTKRLFSEAGYPVIEDPSRAVKVVAALYYFKDRLGIVDRPSKDWSPKPFDWGELPFDTLTEHESGHILQTYGIPIPESIITLTKEQARIAAEGIGYPVVLKGISRKVVHRTEAGLVHLRLEGERQVEAAFEAIERTGKGGDDEPFLGVLVQEMLPPGAVEMIVGARFDPVFGPMILVGAGGIYAEILRDRAMRRAPVTLDVAREMVKGLRCFELLRGARGKPPADVDALCDIIVALGHLVWDHRSHILEVDLNPVLVYPKGKGANAVDALIRLKTESRS